MAKKRFKAKEAIRQAALPAGFTDTSAAGNFPPAWEPEVGDELRGVVTAKREVSAQKLGYANAKKGQQVLVLSVANADGELFSVHQSYALEQFCKNANVRDEVFLRLTEIKKIGKKRLKLYDCGIKAAGKGRDK